ncbi:MAG: 2Fe-2S iron-sulfur cluster-binding protein [Chloroflexota bacterium]
MPSIYIDGQKIEAQKDQTVIEAAYANGIQVPHFCWHPELSVAGNCRMCLVEIGMPKKLPDGSFEKGPDGEDIVNYMPKLQIACATPATEGLRVKIKSEKAKRAQEAVMEFLLINHPLDCPICDEAGECKLQDYAYTQSRGESRFEETKNKKPKRVLWGDTVVYDAERCILCSRCIRYANEEAEQPVLSFIQRNDHVYIEVGEGQKWDNPYSMNVIEICPVGALTSADFRFRARVWEMSFNDSICPGCSRGCNMKVGVRSNNEALRLNPRTNMYVNKYWMCDYGRLTQYRYLNENRVKFPRIKQDGVQVDTSWDEMFLGAADLLKNYRGNDILFVASARATTEDNHVLNKFASEVAGSQNIAFIRHIDESFGDDYLRVSDITPNYTGAFELGIPMYTKEDFIKKFAPELASGKYKAMYVMEEDFSDMPEIMSALDKLELLAVHATNDTEFAKRADLLFAASTYAEIEGTFINIDKRVQLFSPALTTNENWRHMGMRLGRWDKFGADNDKFMQREERLCRQSWAILKGLAKAMGTDFNFKNSEDVFDDIVKNYVAFNAMTYELLEKHQGLVLNRGDKPDPIVVNYESHKLKPE